MVIKLQAEQKPKSGIIWTDTQTLRPYANNAKVHSKAQIKKIAASISEFGFLNAIIIDSHNNIIAGHGRLEAALLLEMTEVPVIQASHLTPAQAKVYRLADNRIAEDAKWDERLLAIEIKTLALETPDLAITHTGFEMGEIDVILGASEDGLLSSHTDSDDAVPDKDQAALPVSQLGDLWVLGQNRLYCGDALDPDSYSKLMGDETAGMVFTDPPYNVPVQGHISGKGKTKHREFAMAAGEMSKDEFTAFLKEALSLTVKASRNGAIHYVCMDWRHMQELLQAGTAAYTELKNLCVWVKSNGGMGSQYRSRHELVFVYKAGTSPHINNVQLGQYGRNRTNVWEYPGVNSFGKDRDLELAMHPTVKPAAMIKDVILDSSNRGDVILDPFLGSGTTLIAAHQTGRRGYGMELDPLYVDTIIRRWQNLTGEQAVNTQTGKLFEEQSCRLEGGHHG
ncbi:MAG: DNA methyltransferase [Litorimonas sp.]